MHRIYVCVLCLLSPRQVLMMPARLPLLEDLAEQYSGTDKARDDHKFVDLYGMMLDPIRKRARNVTEIGIAYGLSLEIWNAFFPNADIWGIDLALSPIVKRRLRGKSRIHLLTADSTDCKMISELGFANESMDVIVDDGPHWAEANEKLLSCMWPTLRPGGFYFIEDVQTGTGDDRLMRKFQRGTPIPTSHFGQAALVHAASTRSKEVERILQENDCFFADTAVGHRAWDRYQAATPTATIDRVNHNSHVLVIRKRVDGPRSRPIRVHSEKLAARRAG